MRGEGVDAMELSARAEGERAALLATVRRELQIEKVERQP